MATNKEVTHEQVLSDLTGENVIPKVVELVRDGSEHTPDGTQTDPGGGNPDGAEGQGGDGQPKDATTKRMREIESFNGRLANELGLARKAIADLTAKLNAGDTAKPDTDDDDDDDDDLVIPHPNDFPDGKSYNKAFRQYERAKEARESAKAQQKSVETAREKSWADAIKSKRVTPEQQAAAAVFYADHSNLDPEFLVLAMKMRNDPHKFLREASQKLQGLLNREFTPTTSGAGGDNAPKAPGSEEQKSFHAIEALLDQNKFSEYDAALEKHVARFGRFVSAT